MRERFTLPALRESLHREMPPWLHSSRLVEAALKLACEAHKGQLRASRNRESLQIPYIVHPVGVALNVLRYWDDCQLSDDLETVVCAALCHDILEDSVIDLAGLEAVTGYRCSEIVLALTKPTTGLDCDKDFRNKRFSDQIIAAGSTAIFLKICDVLHNLSRPDAMPYGLLKKTILKAQGVYLPMLQGQGMPKILGTAIDTAIIRAEAALATQNEGGLRYEPNDVSSFFEYCISLTRIKSVEEHDILDTIRSVPGIKDCAICDAVTFLDRVKPLIPIRAAAVPFFEILERLSPEGEWVWGGDAVTVDHSIYVLMLGRGDDSNSHSLCILADTSIAPSWVSFNMLKAVVGILSEKLNVNRVKEMLNQAEFLSKLGLGLSVWRARAYGLTQSDARRLAFMRESGEFVLHNLREFVSRVVTSFDSSELLDRIEARVKGAASILDKLQSRKEINLESIDDLVGLRLIFLESGSRDRFIEKLMKEIETDSGDRLGILALVPGSVSLHQVSSNLGYKAPHISLRSVGVFNKDESIGCEIQLRTLHEDTWARVSQHLAYKKAGRDQRSVNRLIERLALLRDEADSLIRAATATRVE